MDTYVLPSNQPRLRYSAGTPSVLLHALVSNVNAEIAHHGFQAGTPNYAPAVNPPAYSGHTQYPAHAVDIRINGITSATLRQLALQAGLNPPPATDSVHYTLGTVANPGAGLQATITGRSPVNLLVEDPSGRRIGYDPATGTVVNEIGDYAVYSGPGSEPQVIHIPLGEVLAGAYRVTGVGTSDGAYAIDLAVAGEEADRKLVERTLATGTAIAGAPLAAVESLDLMGEAQGGPPVLDFVPPQEVDEGSILSFEIAGGGPGTDNRFSLDEGPAGAQIDPVSGLFTWTVEEGPAAWPVTVRLVDAGAMDRFDTAAFAIAVRNVAPAVTLGMAAAVGAGAPFTATGWFADPGQDDWTAVVDYGDGTPPQALALGPDKTFSLARTYAAPGTYILRVAVSDEDGGMGFAEVQAIIVPGTIVGGPLDDQYTLRLDPTGEFLDLQIATGAVPWRIRRNTLSQLTIKGQEGNNALTLDLSNGDPLQGLALAFLATTSHNTLRLVGGGGDDAVSLDSWDVRWGSSKIAQYAFDHLEIDAGEGDDTLTITQAPSLATVAFHGGEGLDSIDTRAGTIAVQIGADASLERVLASGWAQLTLDGSADLSLLGIADNARLRLKKGSGGNVFASELAIGQDARLDIGDQVLVLRGGADASGLLSHITSLVRSARNSGLWDGPGIGSAVAAGDSRWSVAVTRSGADLVLASGLAGDSDLNGAIDGADYQRIDHGLLVGLAACYGDGDFDYSGAIDGDDYHLLDAAFLGVHARLAVEDSSGLPDDGLLDYGQVELDGGSFARFTVRNLGALPLNVRMRFVGGSPAEIVWYASGTSNGVSTVIPPGASAAQELWLQPTGVAGQREWQIEITHNDPRQPSPQVLTVRADVVIPPPRPRIDVELPPDLSSPDMDDLVQWVDLPASDMGASATLLLRNQGDAPLEIEVRPLEPWSPFHASMPDDPWSEGHLTLAPGETRLLLIECYASFPAIDVLELVTNDPRYPVYSISLNFDGMPWEG